MERRPTQPTFLDAAAADLGSPDLGRFFELCDKHIPWDDLAGQLTGLFDDTPGKPGRPHWPVVMMLKIIMLKKWFNLSDPQAEHQIKDRLSFRRFLKLTLEENSPDHSTIRLFNQRLRDSGHIMTLFDAVLGCLKDRGLVVNDGSIVDATIMQAPRGKPRADGTHTKDSGATSTSKAGRPYFGYRAHIRSDKRGVLLDYRFDTAKVSEHTHIDDLVKHEHAEVYADSGYMKRARSEELMRRRVFPGIMYRRARGQEALTAAQQAHNKKCARKRAVVEHVFGWLKNMGHRIRYRGLSNNAADFGLMAAAYNLKRMFSLMGMPLSGQASAT